MTGLTVTYNTPNLAKNAILSIRKFYPDMPILVIDGSDIGSPCYKVLDGLSAKIKTLKVIHTHYNIGHGHGMSMGIRMIEDGEILIFDSDIVVKKECVKEMQFILNSSKNIYGVGQVVKVNHMGINDDLGLDYLHPHFMLISKRNYLKCKPYINHGAPCIKAMTALQKQKMIKVVHFPVYDFINHLCRGTRNVLKQEESRRATKTNDQRTD